MFVSYAELRDPRAWCQRVRSGASLDLLYGFNGGLLDLSPRHGSDIPYSEPVLEMTAYWTELVGSVSQRMATWLGHLAGGGGVAEAQAHWYNAHQHRNPIKHDGEPANRRCGRILLVLHHLLYEGEDGGSVLSDVLLPDPAGWEVRHSSSTGGGKGKVALAKGPAI